MALIGGGGAGNVAGGNPSGSGTSLNYVGDHCYAYSGAITSGASGDNIMLDFFTGANSYILGGLQFGFGGIRSNDDERVELYLDQQIVAALVFNNSYERAELNNMEIVIPPQSRVQVKIVKVSGTGSVQSFCWFQGRVYG